MLDQQMLRSRLANGGVRRGHLGRHRAGACDLPRRRWGFGAKSGGYPEDVVVAPLARELDRPVRRGETRSESMLGLVHGRGCVFTATIGGDRDGNIRAYRVHSLQDGGADPEAGGGAAVHHRSDGVGRPRARHVEMPATVEHVRRAMRQA